MKTYVLFFLLLPLCLPVKADDWGRKGHRTTAAIAEQYLSRKARRTINKLLGRESLAVVSTYGDEIKSIPEMRKYGSWHYVNIAPGMSYDESEKNPDGDLVAAIRTCKEKLNAETTSREDQIFYLKMLVHFVGDLHQPLHTGHAEDKGGNDINVEWFGEETNLHSVWDSRILESYGMSYTELTENYGFETKERYKEYAAGGLLDWFNESQQLVKSVYDSAKDGDRLSYAYMEEHKDTVFLQLEKGGIRLAAMLNEIFG